VNLLLDTHVALWALSDPSSTLGPVTMDALRDPRNVVAVSAATVWEIEIKRALGKLDAPDGFARECIERGFDELEITFDHAETAARLPPHHSDPFDRMLIGQAIVEGCQLISTDRTFAAYGVPVLDPAN
jgi:PIN domain nuclease of toxin-antitoxin system